MPIVATLILQATAPLPPAPAWSLDPVTAPLGRALSASPACDHPASEDEIVVCGKRSSRYRLPLPVMRDDPTERHRGEARSGLDALTPPTRCGIFAGERACSKREAADYGYGEGRDPVTLLGKLITHLADPNKE